MARERRQKLHSRTKLVFASGIAFALLAAQVNASGGQSFRIRQHQVITQDYTSADVAQEIRFGQKVAARLLGIETLATDADLIRYVSLIGNSLALHAPRAELTYYFAVLDTDRINAYSTPGGYVFVTKGALAAARDEAEVAAILAHELAHITERHVVRELHIAAADQSNLSGIARFLGSSGGTTQVALSQAIDKAVSIIHDQGYKIDDELQADRVATLLLAQTGYDPLALKRYLLRVEKPGVDNEQRIKTHPTPPRRFANLDKIIQQEKLADLHFPTARQRFDAHIKVNLE
jgi:predicted Zn-dependent protease